MEKWLNIWYHKYFSRVGRLILIKAMLEATPVYLMSLAWIPTGILSRIKNLCCRFLLNGKHRGKYLHGKNGNLFLFQRNGEGGGWWGIKRLENFTTALVAKLGWQLITSHSLWTMVSTSKYIAPQRLMDYLCQP